MLCLVLSGAWSLAYSVDRTESKKDGIPIGVKEGASYSGPDKSTAIFASINGHTLSVVFLENLGQVYIEVEEVGGGEAQSQATPTPNGVNFYITYSGSYIVTFTLPNGDVYYGEFEVRDE